MSQPGILAAAGMYALDNMLPRLKEDHANAKILAKGEHLPKQHHNFVNPHPRRE